ncbi:enoyl-CoA hydratase/isomerase family protein [Pollutimonas bauzanensis]|uniref:Enoyl-CoA hydratase/carnithine racemase n=1 Tax=Pollutimonas bauzanensis TaxID=658167 RepID=A0A1M5URU9_9BURK|nr:enoyl-CoA hydratase-related protein [Pollutimonas bauzanensis]SHH65709.1 Enoyl-CoA hydratase/carnithine racemase [Pollutimonas bauzanensis]
MTDSVVTHIEDAIAWISLNRPDALNAINDDIRQALPAAIDAADANPEVRVIVLRGSGPRAFCVGADIKEFSAVDAPVAYRQQRAHGHWIAAFDRAVKPVIASIHGYCLGGGLEIALACDIRIAAADATFGFPETGHGIIPAAGGTQRISRIIGMGVALDLILTGERIAAQRALSMGLVSRLAEPDALDGLARAMAGRIALLPPLAAQFAKEAVRAGAEVPLSVGMRHEIDLFTHLLNTEDRLEAAQAFREKRSPRFTGR